MTCGEQTGTKPGRAPARLLAFILSLACCSVFGSEYRVRPFRTDGWPLKQK